MNSFFYRFVTLLVTICFLSACAKPFRTEIVGRSTQTGMVISKTHTEKRYLNPLDNVNPMKALDPLFDFKNGRMLTTSRESDIVTISIDTRQVTVNDKIIADSLKVGDKVLVDSGNRYDIILNDKGEEESRIFIQEIIFSIKPI